MSLILGIETATTICSVALSKDGQQIAIKEEGGSYSHAEKLTPFIEAVLQEANMSLKEIDAIAVSKGPGSYTGLRIGTSTAKGLCYALNIPLISVSTLQAMAKKVSESLNNPSKNTLLCPMIDARRMEVYTALYNTQNEVVDSITAKIITPTSFQEYTQENSILYFGDGAKKCNELLKANEQLSYMDEGFPSASYINKIGHEKFLNQVFEDVAYYEPYYLKDFIATTAKKLL